MQAAAESCSTNDCDGDGIINDDEGTGDMSPEIYRAKDGSSDPGFNSGLGLMGRLTQEIKISVGADVHQAGFGDDPNRFITGHLGILFR